jgi:hypothetical protein
MEMFEVTRPLSLLDDYYDTPEKLRELLIELDNKICLK